MKTYCIRYRLAPSVEETKDLLVQAPDSATAAEKAREVLRLRYPHFVIQGIYPGLSFDSDPQQLYPHAGARR